MNQRGVLFTAAIFVAVWFPLPHHLHAAQHKKVRLAFSALAYANPPFWIAHDLKLFEKYGLDSELVYVSGSRPIQAMLGGSIDVSQVGRAAAVAAIAQGAELAMLGTVFSRLTFAIHAGPQIKQISDLKGETIATGSIGGNSYFAALVFLKNFNWVANRDVGVVAAGGSPEVLAGLLQGKFQAGVLTPPTSMTAGKKDPNEFVGTRFIRKLEEEGFCKKFSGT
jgi:ABC-type nitrate/sulfonate/bicarbonate transport system substrate-binding protein